MATQFNKFRKNTVIRILEDSNLPNCSTALFNQIVLIGTTQNRAENIFRLRKIMNSKAIDYTSSPIDLI